MKIMPESRITISIDPKLLVKIDAMLPADQGAYGNRSAWITEHLHRYLAALADARRHLREILSPEETCLLMDNLNGVWHQALTVQCIWGNVADGIDHHRLDKKWDVEGPPLIEKLQGLNYVENAALADAAERFWGAVAAAKTKADQPDPKQALVEPVTTSLEIE